jgi:hypothetical protein
MSLSKAAGAEPQHRIDFTNRAPTFPLKVQARIYHPAYYYLKSLKLKDIKSICPCPAGYTKDDQKNLLRDVERFCAQPVRADDDDHVIVEETYKPPRSGFPGRLYSSSGCQNLKGALRALLLSDTADVDMVNAMPTIVAWICKQFKNPVPQLQFYVDNRDGSNGMLQRIADEENVTQKRAKQLAIMTLTTSTRMRADTYLKKLDAEAKEIQQLLMAVPDLQWILPYCKEDNRAGSFMSHLYHLVENQLIMAVYKVLTEELGVRVEAIVFDGLNVGDKSLHGNQSILDRFQEVCNEICPGINLKFAWKELDFVLKTKVDKKPLLDASGNERKFAVPEDYTPPAPLNGDAPAERSGTTDFKPSYEEMRCELSLNNGENPKVGYGKVGSEYIHVDPDGALTLFDTAHLRAKCKHLAYFEKKPLSDLIDKPFIDKWMEDYRMDARYFSNKDEKYYWERFEMYPDASKCPADVYNLWPGFAAEKMLAEYNEDTRAGLLLILEHFRMLLNRDTAQYDFLLNILAHSLQHPDTKLGIMLCLVGKQGSGKGHVWEVIERIIGARSAFTSSKPDKDVWGDNNAKMRDSFFVRITEANKEKFKGFVGELRTLVTDETIRVRSLYCTAANIKNYSRFFLDTNFVDAVPDEHGERRFFIIKCCEDKIGDHEYFEALCDAIADDAVIRALFDFLCARKIKKMYLGKDIPVGEYQKALKDSRRSLVEHFLEWLVEDQPLDDEKLKLTTDQLCDKYKAWQQNGTEFERSKSSITRELQLKSISGIKKSKERDWVVAEDGTQAWKLVSYWTFDLKKLRELYSIDKEEALAPEPQAVIDCAADVAAWEKTFSQRSLPDGDEGSDDDHEPCSPGGPRNEGVGAKRKRADDEDDWSEPPDADDAPHPPHAEDYD